MSFTVLAGDFKKGSGHSFSDGKLVLIKLGDDDLKEEISGKTISSIAVKKTEGATRGLVPFECTLKDGRSFVAETDISTYKALAKQAQDNKKNQEESLTNETARDSDTEKKGASPLFSPLFKVIVSLVVVSVIFGVSQIPLSDETKAYRLCEKTIRSITLDPKKADVPRVEGHKRDGEYSFGWFKGTTPIRTKNNLGLKVPVNAMCDTNAEGTKVTFLLFDGSIIISASPWTD